MKKALKILVVAACAFGALGLGCVMLGMGPQVVPTRLVRAFEGLTLAFFVLAGLSAFGVLVVSTRTPKADRPDQE